VPGLPGSTITWAGPYPDLSEEELRAGLDLLPTWVLAQKAAAFSVLTCGRTDLLLADCDAFRSDWRPATRSADTHGPAGSTGSDRRPQRRWAMAQPKVVLKAAEARGGAPMERNPGVRDRKLVYPETGFPTRSLIMGIVEVQPGCRAPAHRHNCEEVYYVLDGRGEVVSDGVPHAFEAGDAVYNAPNSVHTVRNTGGETLRLLVVGGIMFVGLVPRWPTESPYELLDDGEYPG
jgi:quercetin dioxygenase-like cupin family protein